MAAEVRLAGAMLAQNALVRTQACAEQVPQGGDDHRIRRPPVSGGREGLHPQNRKLARRPTW